MALEVGVAFINDLVITNPVAGDPRSEGDDHIRNIKKALRAVFPHATQALGAIVRTATEPANKYASLVWVDITVVTACPVKYYDGTDWITLPIIIDETNNTGRLLVTATDTGATAGPMLFHYWNSASPAAADAITLERITARNSTPADKVNFETKLTLSDVTAASEDAVYTLRTVVAGTLADRLSLGAGLFTANATGGDKGAESINASRIYSDGAGVWQTLDSSAASGATYTKDSIPAWVNHLRITVDLFPVSNNVTLQFFARKGAGTDIAVYQVEKGVASGTTPTVTQSAGAIQVDIVGSIQNTANSGGCNAQILITNIQSARYKRSLLTIGSNDASLLYSMHASARIDDTAVLTGVKLKFDSGNINDGRVLLEGCA